MRKRLTSIWWEIAAGVIGAYVGTVIFNHYSAWLGVFVCCFSFGILMKSIYNKLNQNI